MPHNQGGMKTDEERQAGEIAGGYTEEDGGKTQTDQILLQDIFYTKRWKNFSGAITCWNTQNNVMPWWQDVLKLDAGH